MGEPLHREFNARAARLTSMVQGRTIYETMQKIFPAARQDDALPDYLREYGEMWTSKPKVLAPRTRTDAPHNTRAIGRDGDAMEQLARLCDDSAGDIGVGGALSRHTAAPRGAAR
ncbi:hypothetical protein [Micromonospora sp. DT233]|uniref:hypothetical protein n=1 Tax=Micromonospora sp. DT233 TaxID=3393432 RepID=UPI003CF5BE51